MAELLRYTGWESLWAHTSAHNPQRWPRGRTMGHCSQEEDKVGQSHDIPRPRGMGQSTSLLRWLATGSISTCNQLLCPYLYSVVFFFISEKKAILIAVWNFRLFYPHQEKWVTMQWWNDEPYFILKWRCFLFLGREGGCGILGVEGSQFIFIALFE